MKESKSAANGSQTPGRFWRTRTGAVFMAFLGAAGLLLVYEHRVHIFAGNGLLIALLVVCTGMHFLMHRGHRDHGDKREDSDRQDSP